MAAAGAYALAQGKDTMAGSEDLLNPVSKYPKPPFAKELQPWPGLAGKMQPPPDHGENSYKGSGRLTGRKAVNGAARGGRTAYFSSSVLQKMQ